MKKHTFFLVFAGVILMMVVGCTKSSTTIIKKESSPFKYLTGSLNDQIIFQKTDSIFYYRSSIFIVKIDSMKQPDKKDPLQWVSKIVIKKSSGLGGESFASGTLKFSLVNRFGTAINDTIFTNVEINQNQIFQSTTYTERH